ncbi:hypothetical protein 66901_38 [Lactococcus phage 66901]|uniref:Uncharacterized protein n=1 Tax=Lactococcus phage 66901 TaxID=2029671 RepID=A0A343JQF7_9CAUD|nr:hypothetical protein HYP37_gp38 [Lactococcus phage 66901]ASZ71730.1 hypothetical protein 66901_38 [Lactococcus phage 66901]
MVVKLTQEQADYLETFKKIDKAIYYISRWGWDYPLLDGNEKVYKKTEEKPFKVDEKLKMLNAMISGYEVIVPKFKFHTFSDITNLSRLYYAGKNVQLTANYKEAETVDKNTEEYFILENLGFYKEEV